LYPLRTVIDTYIALLGRGGFPVRVQVLERHPDGRFTAWPPLGVWAERDDLDPLLFVVRHASGTFTPLLPAPQPQPQHQAPPEQAAPLVTLAGGSQYHVPRLVRAGAVSVIGLMT